MVFRKLFPLKYSPEESSKECEHEPTIEKRHEKCWVCNRIVWESYTKVCKKCGEKLGHQYRQILKHTYIKICVNPVTGQSITVTLCIDCYKKYKEIVNEIKSKYSGEWYFEIVNPDIVIVLREFSKDLIETLFLNSTFASKIVESRYAEVHGLIQYLIFMNKPTLLVIPNTVILSYISKQGKKS